MYTEPHRALIPPIRRYTPPTYRYVMTSVGHAILGYAKSTHQRRRISSVSGPPGIGKTAALLEFQKENHEDVVFVKVARKDAPPTIALKFMFEALRDCVANQGYYPPATLSELKNAIYNILCDRDGKNIRVAHDRGYNVMEYRPLTVVFDEAQYLSRDFIDMIRFWSDEDNSYGPFPLSFLLVGNTELLLQPDDGGRTHISRAIGDRLLHSHTFEYSDVTDDDLRLYADDRAHVSEEVMAFILEEYRRPGAIRSFRPLRDALDDALADADGGEITLDMMREALDRQRRAGFLNKNPIRRGKSVS